MDFAGNGFKPFPTLSDTAILYRPCPALSRSLDSINRAGLVVIGSVRLIPMEPMMSPEAERIRTPPGTGTILPPVSRKGH